MSYLVEQPPHCDLLRLSLLTSRFVRNRRTYLLIQSLSIDAGGGGVPHPHLLSAARSLEGEAGVLLALLRAKHGVEVVAWFPTA